MSLAEKHLHLLGQFSLIDDPQERLAAVVDRARHRPALPPHERTEAQRIRGCVSAAWLVAEVEEGRCRFRTDADSPLVRGLLALLAEVYTGATPDEIMAHESSLLDDLRLTGSLSPTRLNGLRAAAHAIKEFARATRASP